MPVSRCPNDPNVWWSRFYDDDGVRRQIPCSSTQFEGPEWAKLKAEVTLCENAGPKSRKDLVDISAVAVVECHLRGQIKRGVTAKSVSGERGVLKRCFLELLPKDLTIGQLKLEHCAEIRSALERRYRPATVRNYLQYIQRMLNDAHFKGHLRSNPMKVAMTGFKLDIDAATRHITIPSEAEIELLRSVAAPQQLALLDMMTFCGASPTELTRLRWDDCQLDKGKVFIRDVVLPSEDPTDPSGRWVELPPMVVASLLRWRLVQRNFHASALVFPGHDNGPAQAWQVHEALSRLQLRCRLLSGVAGEECPKYVAGDFQHVAGRRWAEQGVSLKVLSARMGHVSSTTTWRHYQKYLRAKDPRQALASVQRLLRKK